MFTGLLYMTHPVKNRLLKKKTKKKKITINSHHKLIQVKLCQHITVIGKKMTFSSDVA